MKKIPLYFGLFLIMVWGASQKIASPFEGDDKAKKEEELVLNSLRGFDESLDLSTLSWAEFHRICHPQFSELTDEALYQLYKELKKQETLFTYEALK